MKVKMEAMAEKIKHLEKANTTKQCEHTYEQKKRPHAKSKIVSPGRDRNEKVATTKSPKKISAAGSHIETLSSTHNDNEPTEHTEPITENITKGAHNEQTVNIPPTGCKEEKSNSKRSAQKTPKLIHLPESTMPSIRNNEKRRTHKARVTAESIPKRRV